MPEQTPTLVTTATAWTIVSGDEYEPTTEAVIVGSEEEAREICRAQNIRRLEAALVEGQRQLVVWRIASQSDLAFIASSARVDLHRRRGPFLVAGDRVRIVVDQNWHIGTVTRDAADENDLVVELPPGTTPAPVAHTVDTDRVEATVRVSIDAQAWAERGHESFGRDADGFRTWIATLVDDAVRLSYIAERLGGAPVVVQA